MPWPLTLAWSIVCATAPVALAQPEREARVIGRRPDDGVLDIASKWVAAFDVALIERTGPYWALGGVTSEVREIMQVRGVAGPLFVRFSGDPLRERSSSLTSEVGFAVPAGGTVAPPLVGRHRPGERVAFVVIEGRVPDPRRDYARVADWARNHGHTPAGPITEIYLSPTGDRASGPPRVEVQVVIEPQNEETVVIGDPGDSPVEIPDVRETSRGFPANSPGSLRERLDRGEFDVVAELILPEGDKLTVSQRRWLAQFVWRVEAAAKGVGRLHDHGTDQFAALSHSLGSRYRVLCDGAWRSSAVSNVTASGVSWDAGPTDASGIMRDVDRLLGGIAYRTLGPEQSWTELADLLERVNDLILQTANDKPLLREQP